MLEFGGFTGLGFQELRFLNENIRAELSDYHKYNEQARLASNPLLRQLWRRFAQDELQHARLQRHFLRQSGYTGVGAPMAGGLDPWWEG